MVSLSLGSVSPSVCFAGAGDCCDFVRAAEGRGSSLGPPLESSSIGSGAAATLPSSPLSCFTGRLKGDTIEDEDGGGSAAAEGGAVFTAVAAVSVCLGSG